MELTTDLKFFPILNSVLLPVAFGIQEPMYIIKPNKTIFVALQYDAHNWTLRAFIKVRTLRRFDCINDTSNSDLTSSHAHEQKQGMLYTSHKNVYIF
jgi:hypothetical protein